MIRERSAAPEMSVLWDTNNMQEMVEACPTSLIKGSPASMDQMMMVQSSDAEAKLVSTSCGQCGFKSTCCQYKYAYNYGDRLAIKRFSCREGESMQKEAKRRRPQLVSWFLRSISRTVRH